LKQYEIDSNFFSNIISKGNILDVGCSDGIFLNKLNQLENYCLFGIDPDELAIKNAKKKFPKIKFKTSNLLGFQPKTKFDAIIFRGSFQFLGLELHDTLKKLPLISKHNAKIFLFSLPNSDSFLYYLLKEKWNLFDTDSHKLIFNKFSIEKLCKLYNFEIEHFSYPYIGTPYANPSKDYKKIIQSIYSKNYANVPFWGNIMQFVLKIK
jgi:SAM-dependent methyltransferase